jgi:hypothetical protein
MKTRLALVALMTLTLLAASPLPGKTPVAVAAGQPPAALEGLPLVRLERQLGDVIEASTAVSLHVYLPLAKRALDCSTGDTFATGPASQTEPPFSAANHPDKNPFGVRGYSVIAGQKTPLPAGSYDPHGYPPQLSQLFDTPRNGFTFANSYYINDLHDPERPGGPASGITTSIGELIRVPDSWYTIGGTPVAYEVLVLYADANSITMKYTREDNMATGYGIHLRNICVDPNLLALYNQIEASGVRYVDYGNRSDQYFPYNLVNLRARQAIGRAATNELIVSIRDVGSFMGPYYCDWWQGYAGCPMLH